MPTAAPRAASRRQIAAPMPREPPVTIATCPFQSMTRPPNLHQCRCMATTCVNRRLLVFTELAIAIEGLTDRPAVELLCPEQHGKGARMNDVLHDHSRWGPGDQLGAGNL